MGHNQQDLIVHFIPLKAAISLPYLVTDLDPMIWPHGASTAGGFPCSKLGKNHSGPTYRTIDVIKKYTAKLSWLLSKKSNLNAIVTADVISQQGVL